MRPPRLLSCSVCGAAFSHDAPNTRPRKTCSRRCRSRLIADITNARATDRSGRPDPAVVDRIMALLEER